MYEVLGHPTLHSEIWSQNFKIKADINELEDIFEKKRLELYETSMLLSRIPR